MFQFFSGMNSAYSKLVRFNGYIQDEKSTEFEHLKQLYDKVIQGYLREARRSFEIKVFKALVWRKGAPEPDVIYFTNRIEIGSMQ